MNRQTIRTVAITAISLVALSGCAAASSSGAASPGGAASPPEAASPSVAASSGGGGTTSIKVAWQSGDPYDSLFTGWKQQFEAQYPNVTVELIPINANESDYYTKLALLNSTPSTAPDITYEDSSYLAVDAAAGRFAPLDDYVAKWDGWSQFPKNVQDYARGFDGKVYGITLGTDAQVAWYNKDIFAKAGIQVPWQPKTWADLLDTAKTIKAKVPDVTPINIYAGKAALDAASVRGQELLTSGTKDGYVYDGSTQKWVLGSQGFIDALQMDKDIYQGGLGLPPEVTSDPNYPNIVPNDLLPQGKLAIAIDGSWITGGWSSSGTGAWPEWSTVMGAAAVPTQFGQDPGKTSMSGGWMLSMGATSAAKDEAWNFIAMAVSKDSMLKYDVDAGQIAERADVAADPTYAGDPLRKFFADLVPLTHFIPTANHTAEVQVAMNDAQQSVMTGEKTPQQAAADYDQAVIGIVGQENTEPAQK